MGSVNIAIVTGHLGKDAELKLLPGGKAVTNFSIATSHSWKDAGTGERKEQTEWHNIVLWGSENVVPYLTKGKLVNVTGRLQTRSYEKDGHTVYRTEIVCNDLQLLGGKSDGDSKPSSPRPSPAATPKQESFGADDDVPF